MKRLHFIVLAASCLLLAFGLIACGSGGGGGGTSQPNTALCGDGGITGAEECDDGNAADGDGCSASCLIETAFQCTGGPSVCATTCGDGIIDTSTGEECDDGGAADGDGCSASCLIETAYQCAGEPSVCTATCGDGVIDSGTGELCDDNNAIDGDGCSAACQVEAAYQCAGEPSLCTTTCSDGVIDISVGEQCDDGNTASGDGCSNSCQTESGYQCTGTPSACTPLCGDGIRSGSEQCDDGSTVGGDGCSDICEIESGYQCNGLPSVCKARPVGLVIAEVFSNHTDQTGNTESGDNLFEWVKLYNGSADDVDLSEYSLGYGGGTYTMGTYQLSGMIPAGECTLVGGPNGDAASGNPVFDLPQNFTPNIQNATNGPGDAIALFIFPASTITVTTIPHDAVVYGTNNNHDFIDDSGTAPVPHVASAPVDQSIRFDVNTDTWSINPTPTPNACP